MVQNVFEVNKVHAKSISEFKSLFSVIGGKSCRQIIFFVPVFAGTVVKPIKDIFTGSFHPPLQIPLPLLSNESSMSIMTKMLSPLD